MTFIKANLLVQSKLRSFLTGDNLSNFGAFLEFCKGDFKVPHVRMKINSSRNFINVEKTFFF